MSTPKQIKCKIKLRNGEEDYLDNAMMMLERALFSKDGILLANPEEYREDLLSIGRLYNQQCVDECELY